MFPQSLSKRKEIDKIKENYCISNGIKFLAIPYWNIYNSNNYKKKINNILNQK